MSDKLNRNYKFKIIHFENEIEKDEERFKTVLQKNQKKNKGCYFDCYTDEKFTLYLFSDFKTKDTESKMALEMFIYLSYAFAKKNDTIIFDDLLFKEKQETGFKIIELKLNVK